VRHDLEHRGQDGPQRGPGDVQEVKSDEPEQSDGERVLKLSDGPVLEGAAGDGEMVGEVHGRFFNKGQYQVFLARNTSDSKCIGPSGLKALRMTDEDIIRCS